MPLVGNIKFHDYQFAHLTATGTWRWTTRLDVSGSAPLYTVRDILTPYGLLRDSVPLPGELIQAMAESIVELRASFAPSVLLGPPSSLTFVVDEGRGFAEGQSARVTNNGAYGSLLQANLAASAEYLRLTPAVIGGLAAGEWGLFMVEVDSSSLAASGSPYEASVTVSDPTAAGSPATFPLTITVRPKAQIQTSVGSLTYTVTRPSSGPFPAITPQTFEVRNVGPSGSFLSYEVRKLTGTADWLTATNPAYGELVAGGSEEVEVVVVPTPAMGPGTYTEVLRVSGYSANDFVDVQIQLVIS